MSAQASATVKPAWSKAKQDFPNYLAGGWGPKASDEMLARHGREWRKP